MAGILAFFHFYSWMPDKKYRGALAVITFSSVSHAHADEESDWKKGKCGALSGGIST
ncbi:hypothetical protein [Acetobacter persici]|uniref:hypothetical protein n=1 Tax=Acetobacter persici TaxID=1076596 RepID=UPI0039EBE34E